MSGTTPCQGWRYNDLPDPFQRINIENLARDMDASLTTAAAKIEAARNTPYVAVSRTAAPATAVGFDFNIVPDTADDDPFDLFMSNASTIAGGAIYIRPGMSGLWHVDARLRLTSLPTTMTRQHLYITNGITTPTTVTGRSVPGNNQQTAASGVFQAVAGSSILLWYRWDGSGTISTMSYRLRATLLSRAGQPVYQESFEDVAVPLAGWTVTGGSLVSNLTWASKGVRSLLLTPNGVAATVIAKGPSFPIQADPLFLYLGAFAVIRSGATAVPNARIGIEYTDNIGGTSTSYYTFAQLANQVSVRGSGNHNVFAVYVSARVVIEIFGTPPASNQLWFDEVSVDPTGGAYLAG